MIDPGITQLSAKVENRSLATLNIDVIADLACPWCLLGKRRLDRALEAVHGPSLVSWYPFQINPDMPPEGMGFEEYLTKKFGDLKDVQPGLDKLVDSGHAHDVRFRFDRIDRVPNTLDAHRLLQLAAREDASGSELAELILRGFFEDGHDIGDRDVLVSLGEAAGLPRRAIVSVLEDDASRQVVLGQEAQVRKSGVLGVPNFLVNKRLFVTGAQATETLVNVFDRAMFGKDSDQPVSPVVH